MAQIRVLLAEDHVVVRESIREYLSKHDDIAVVGEAGDGMQALELTKELHPDVAVIDVAMPRLNGIDAARQIKAAYPGTKVIVLSAYDYDEYVFAALRAGAAGYLLKDVSGQYLVDAIRAVFNGELALHPTIARKVIEEFRERAAPPDVRGHHTLSEAEMALLKGVAKGLSNRELAVKLHVSPRTVEARLATIFGKLSVSSRTEAVIHALKAGWLKLEDLFEES